MHISLFLLSPGQLAAPHTYSRRLFQFIKEWGRPLDSFLLITAICLLGGGEYHCVHVKVRGQPVGTGSLHRLCGSLGWNSLLTLAASALYPLNHLAGPNELILLLNHILELYLKFFRARLSSHIVGIFFFFLKNKVHSIPCYNSRQSQVTAQVYWFYNKTCWNNNGDSGVRLHNGGKISWVLIYFMCILYMC